MNVLRVLLVIALTPAAIAGALLWLPRQLQRLVNRIRSRLDRPRGGRGLRPTGPPLEQIATDLRRLMAEHQAISSSAGVASRANRLIALEGAITDVALDAARALGVEPPLRRERAPLPRARLRLLLEALVDNGLVLPALDRFGR